jgi:uncharacterized protein involved in exopolysaccharide biosynthesis
VDQNEVVRRVFGEHWKLIALYVALAIAVVGALHLGDERSYTASTRIVLDTQDPASRAESSAIADTARAIATSPGQVSAALSAAHIEGRDVAAVAEHDVSVRALGSSGILELSVRDRDPRAAAALANTLADRLIRARLAVTQGQFQSLLDDLARQIEGLTKSISSADTKVDSLSIEAATASNAREANVLRARRDEAERNRDFLAQERSVLESQRVGLLSSDALRPKPSIISSATVPQQADASPLPSDLALAALLGLILGIGVAGLLEAFRPTVVGGDALAKEFGAPLLGTLSSAPDDDGVEKSDSAELAARVGVAARAAALRKVALVPVGPKVDVEPLARRLQAASPHSASALMDGTAIGISPFESDKTLQNGSGGGLVLVVPLTVKKAEIAEAGHLLSLSRLPLLGLIAYGRPRPLWWSSPSGNGLSRESP